MLAAAEVHDKCTVKVALTLVTTQHMLVHKPGGQACSYSPFQLCSRGQRCWQLGGAAHLGHLLLANVICSRNNMNDKDGQQMVPAQQHDRHAVGIVCNISWVGRSNSTCCY